MVEFALGFVLILSILGGIWHFGYAFYVYSSLHTAVRNGARYASLADYDGGSANGAAFKARVKNHVVYGNPYPPTAAKEVVLGLQTSMITVSPTLDSNGVPTRVTVQVDGFPIPGGPVASLSSFTLKKKPACSFDYFGRYTVQ